MLQHELRVETRYSIIPILAVWGRASYTALLSTLPVSLRRVSKTRY